MAVNKFRIHFLYLSEKRLSLKACMRVSLVVNRWLSYTSPFLMTVQPFRICPSSPVISFLVRTRFPVSSKNTLREAIFTSGSESSRLSLKIRWI